MSAAAGCGEQGAGPGKNETVPGVKARGTAPPDGTPAEAAGGPAADTAADPLADVTAGPWTDPLTGQHLLLVQDIGPERLADPALLERTREQLHERHPGVSAALLRTPGGVHLEAPWRRHITHVRCTDPEALPDPEHDVEIGPPDGPADDEQVRAWLTEAFVRGGADSGQQVQPSTAREVAASLYELPTRVSLLARRDGRVVGHATLLTDTEDVVTGEATAELVDILVAPGEEIWRITARLSRAAASHSIAHGQPLIGNVVHSASRNPAEGGKDTWRIVERLLKSGWRLDHEYWRAPAPGTEDRA